MQCPKYQFDNREGAKFCIECGTKLEFNCAKCSHLNPPASKFCEKCGSTLTLTSEKAPKALLIDKKLEKNVCRQCLLQVQQMICQGQLT